MTSPDPWVVLAEAVESTPIAHCPRLLGELERLKASLWLRITIGNQGGAPRQQDRLLTAEELAARLQVTPAFIYKKARDYPFTIRQGRYVRFSENGLTKYLDRHQGK